MCYMYNDRKSKNIVESEKHIYHSQHFEIVVECRGMWKGYRLGLKLKQILQIIHFKHRNASRQG